MIDIHSHIMPFVDDGAEDYEMSVRMLEMAAAEGITHIIATPHFIHGSLENGNPRMTRQGVDDLMIRVGWAGMDMKIFPGCEVYIDPVLPELLQSGQLCTLNDTRYVLVELPLSCIPIYTEEVMFQLMLGGYVPIIAHPERNAEIMKKPALLSAYVERGLLCQINASSLTGLYGRHVQKAAMKIVKSGMAHFVGTDAHTCRGRSPRFKAAYSIVMYETDARIAHRLFRENGMAVLSDSIIKHEWP